MPPFEHTLLVVRQVSVYKIPPCSTSGGYKSGDWLQTDKIWTGRLRVVSCQLRCEIRLEDPTSGDLFATCSVPPGHRESAVEPALDSSTYFVLRIADGIGKYAFIGLGFAERNEAFDLNVALSDHENHVKREIEEEANAGGKTGGGEESQIGIHPAVNHRLKMDAHLKFEKVSKISGRSLADCQMFCKNVSGEEAGGEGGLSHTNFLAPLVLLGVGGVGCYALYCVGKEGVHISQEISALKAILSEGMQDVKLSVAEGFKGLRVVEEVNLKPNLEVVSKGVKDGLSAFIADLVKEILSIGIDYLKRFEEEGDD